MLSQLLSLPKTILSVVLFFCETLLLCKVLLFRFVLLSHENKNAVAIHNNKIIYLIFLNVVFVL